MPCTAVPRAARRRQLHASRCATACSLKWLPSAEAMGDAFTVARNVTTSGRSIVTQSNGLLDPAFRDLRDCLADIRAANFEGAQALLARLIAHFDEEPLKSLLLAAHRQADFDAWWKATSASTGGMAGSGVLQWPTDRGQRVTLQVELCRRLASGAIRFLDFTHDFTNPHPSRSLSDHSRRFCQVVLEPLVRDIARLPEDRPLSPVVREAMSSPQRSGDQVLDELIAEACRFLNDSAPSASRQAVEKLWDAWERLKTLRAPNDKKASISALLDAAAGSSEMRSVLDDEARCLTAIGNTFHIRHFEVGKIELTSPEHCEYLFHRLYALMHLILQSERRNAGISR